MTGKERDRQEAEQDDATFSSDVIDLSTVDLSDLSVIPGPVLRSSLQRICRELAEDTDVFAGFQNSLSQARPGGDPPEPSPPEGRPTANGPGRPPGPKSKPRGLGHSPLNQSEGDR